MAVNLPHTVEFERGVSARDLLRAQPDQVRFVFVPYRRFLMIDGRERPGGSAFTSAIGALYPVAYTLHFALKHRGVDASVGALEGQYWIDTPGPLAPETFAQTDDGRTMSWRLQLPVPDEATDDEIVAAIEQVRSRKNPPALRWMRCEGWLEAESAQTLHVGPYGAEYPTISRVHAAIADAGFRPRGCHHEIYLSGPTTTSERTRTLIRQPVEEANW
jgi:hypothetical protein